MGDRKARGALPGVTWLVMLAVLLAGCSDSKSRDAAKKLLEETEIAARLYATAVSLMGSTPAKIDGQYLPLAHVARVRDDSTVELSPPLTVHPEAWGKLLQAEQGLSRALAQYSRSAGPEETALASAMLGNILMLKADYQLAATAVDRQDALGTLALVDRTASMVQLYAGLANYYNQLVSLRSEDIVEMQSAARARAAQARADSDKLRQELADLRARAAQLRQSSETLIPQARRLRLDAEQTTGQRGMDMLDQAFKLEKQTNDNVSALAVLENTIELRQPALSDLTLAVQEAEGRQKAAETVLAARRGNTQAGRGELEAIQAALLKAKSDVQDLTAHLADVCARIGLAEDTATEDYTQAIRRHEEARGLVPRSQSGQVAARLADAHWGLAELKDRSLDLHNRNGLLLERLAATWSPATPTSSSAPAIASPAGPVADVPANLPAFARGLLAYVPDPAQARADAVEHYQQAADFYDMSSGQVPPKLRWAYQGQTAAAYIALYRLSGDPEVLTKAKEALDQALQDRRQSHFLAAVVELEKLLKSSTTQAAPPSEPNAPAVLEPNEPAVLEPSAPAAEPPAE